MASQKKVQRSQRAAAQRACSALQEEAQTDTERERNVTERPSPSTKSATPSKIKCGRTPLRAARLAKVQAVFPDSRGNPRQAIADNHKDGPRDDSSCPRHPGRDLSYFAPPKTGTQTLGSARREIVEKAVADGSAGIEHVEEAEDDVAEDDEPVTNRDAMEDVDNMNGPAVDPAFLSEDLFAEAQDEGEWVESGAEVAEKEVVPAEDDKEDGTEIEKDEVRDRRKRPIAGSRSVSSAGCTVKKYLDGVFEDERERVTLETVASGVNSIRSVLNEMCARLEGVESRLSSVLAMKECGGVGMIAGRPTIKKEGGRRNGEGAISRYNTAMEKAAPNVNLYFSDKLWSHAIIDVTVQHMWDGADGEKYNIGEAYHALTSMLFSLSDHKGKDQFLTPVGKRASQYRFNVLRKVLDLARARTYPREIPMNSDVCLEDFPYWLENDPATNAPYITEEHIKAGQSQHERNCSNTSTYHRRVAIGNGSAPEEGDIAVYIVTQIYETMKKMFRDRRRRVNEDFVEVFAYLFVKWSQFNKVMVSENSLVLRWVKATGDFEELPFSNISRTQTENKASINASARNKLLFDRLYQRMELKLFVQHDVVLASSHLSAGRLSPEAVHEYPHQLNMMLPITALLLSWAGLPRDTEPFRLLMYNPNTLKVMYGMAMVFRFMVSVMGNRPVGDGLNNPLPAELPCSPEEKVQLRDIFRMLVPGSSVSERATEYATMKLPDEVFEKYRLHPSGKKNANAHASAVEQRVGKKRKYGNDINTGDGETRMKRIARRPVKQDKRTALVFEDDEKGEISVGPRTAEAGAVEHKTHPTSVTEGAAPTAAARGQSEQLRSPESSDEMAETARADDVTNDVDVGVGDLGLQVPIRERENNVEGAATRKPVSICNDTEVVEHEDGVEEHLPRRVRAQTKHVRRTFDLDDADGDDVDDGRRVTGNARTASRNSIAGKCKGRGIAELGDSSEDECIHNILAAQPVRKGMRTRRTGIAQPRNVVEN